MAQNINTGAQLAAEENRSEEDNPAEKHEPRTSETMGGVNEEGWMTVAGMSKRKKLINNDKCTIMGDSMIRYAGDACRRKGINVEFYPGIHVEQMERMSDDKQEELLVLHRDKLEGIIRDMEIKGEIMNRKCEFVEHPKAAGGETHGRDGSFRILQVNCRSLVKKTLEFHSLIEIHEPDVIVCTETWLKEEISDAEIFPSTFHTFRKDRLTKGGGICISVRKEFETSINLMDQEHEILSVNIKGKNGKRLEAIVAYRPPDACLGILERLGQITSDGIGNNKPLIIAWDLNLPHVFNLRLLTGILLSPRIQPLLHCILLALLLGGRLSCTL
ncbi:hypothetical protein J437_LFUL015779 [Ladona fulva]|uniref:Endonuclease/exonuclease/phosphatase domain-containing protein n=1 Tax=Ladona fulva TaxID=123851 RepID=A0A8K0P9S5_LADFU|nr:hypothetical protein J437_LFUL015779 [Ladona fulva]